MTDYPIYQAEENINIDGVLFHRWEGSSGAAGYLYDSKINRVFKNGQCYEIILTLHAASDYYKVSLGEIEKSKDNAWRRLDQILSTFKFID